ncbi:copper resistance protein [Phyllobacterium brassicacearum]|uniref:Copper resistance protein n=1 Tax=Phyllobacterium brassicacearum TaxID=314235 RepID=A0A2P7B4N4_9HYPH|nr:TolC family protein [Phyllobacterium brassicacearum]PSH61435.1 copper resistance protein [Phyllobacterium brassicacearum]TDQ13493.1 outer membrane protein TolC [Phyllobacterium brassicacearum]
MRRPTLKILVAVAGPLVVSGCASSGMTAAVSDPAAGFSTVQARTSGAIGKQAVWAQSQAETKSLAERIRNLVYKKTIGADTAVQVALLNNRGLQAAYAEVGLSAADVWQETMPVNPTASVSYSSIGIGRIIETAITSNILAMMTRSRRVGIADARFRQAQLNAAQETLRVAADTRRAWINAVAAWETVSYLNRSQVAADAASDLAQKLGETGAFSKTGQAREHVFNAELTGETAKARLNARLAKEELTRLMGLWGQDVDYSVPNALPALPKGPKNKSGIEAEALRNRIDLDVAKLELEATAKSYGLTNATRYVTDLQLMGGVEVEQEEEEGDKKDVVSGAAELEFSIPIFDTGQARMRKAELTYVRVANLLAEKAVNVRSETRSAYQAYRSTYDIARHYRNSVLPLRAKIEEESILTYNGMITNTFELLADTRARITSNILSLNAKREFYLAEVNLGTAIYGGGSESGGGETEVAAAEADEE